MPNAYAVCPQGHQHSNTGVPLYPGVPMGCPQCNVSVRLDRNHSHAVRYHGDALRAPRTLACGSCGVVGTARDMGALIFSVEPVSRILCQGCFSHNTDVCPSCAAFHPVGHACRCGYVRGEACQACYEPGRGRGLPVDWPAGEKLITVPTEWPVRYRGKKVCAPCYKEDTQYSSHGPGTIQGEFKRNPYQRRIGFELEFYAQGMPKLWEYGQLKTDGSVHDRSADTIAREFSTVPMLGDGLLHSIEVICAELKRCRASVTNTCGFHVHLDMRPNTDEQRDNVRDWWATFEPLLFAAVDPTRRENLYCTKASDPPREGRHHRYKALNLTALDRWGTFEVRLHHGTVDQEQITFWCMLLLQAFDRFAKEPFDLEQKRAVLDLAPRERLHRFRKMVGLSRQDWVTLVGRFKTYNTRHDFVRLVSKTKPERPPRPVEPDYPPRPRRVTAETAVRYQERFLRWELTYSNMRQQYERQVRDWENGEVSF